MNRNLEEVKELIGEEQSQQKKLEVKSILQVLFIQMP